MLLNVCSTVAVVTGNTSKIAASFAKLGNATEISPLPNNLEAEEEERVTSYSGHGESRICPVYL